MVEIWKDIDSYEGMYQISNSGIIKSLDRTTQTPQSKTGVKIVKGKILLTWKGKDNYYRVFLSKNAKSKNYLVHRLIANAFIPNPENKLCINHINGIKTDNRIENLEWATHSENEKHSYTQLNRKPSYGMQGKTGELCKCSIPIICSNGKEYVSITQAASELNLQGSNISRVCRGKQNHTGGFVFKYAQNNCTL